MGKNLASRVERLEAVCTRDVRDLSDRELFEYLEWCGAPAESLERVTDDDLAGIAELNPDVIQDAELRTWLEAWIRGGPSVGKLV